MLSADSARVVRATADLIASHGEHITGLFYRRMFHARPELLDLFNRGNQANGEQRQALAAAVVAFARLAASVPSTAALADPGLAPVRAMLTRIAHKHVSVGVTPNQYLVVGRFLLGAVGEVLGDAVTEEVRAAWEEVYWTFACLLVAEEARVFQRVGTDCANPFRAHRVRRRVVESPDVVSLWLSTDSTAAEHPRPGQYVGVAVELPGGGRQIRQYTISSAGGGAEFRITVKRHRADQNRPAGLVSTHLHDRVHEGDTLLVSPPLGDLAVPADGAPLVLATAGIGVTPAAAVLDQAASAGEAREIVLVHADHTPTHHALRAEMLRRAATLPRCSVHLWYGADHASGSLDAPVPVAVHRGRVDPAAVPLPAECRVLLCGPPPFMRQLRRGLLDRGVPEDRVHYEVFGPDAWLPAAAAAVPTG